MALSDSPSPSLAGVRAYMLYYPYGCFEQRLSKAVALDDRAAWSAMMNDLPAYTDRNGLLATGRAITCRSSRYRYALSSIRRPARMPKELREKLLTRQGGRRGRSTTR